MSHPQQSHQEQPGKVVTSNNTPSPEPIRVIPDVVEVGGHKRVRITIQRGRQILGADLVNPLDATRRQKAARSLASAAGDPHFADRIEEALLQAVDEIRKADAEVEASPEDAPNRAMVRKYPDGSIKVVRPELFIEPGVVALSVPETVVSGRNVTGRSEFRARHISAAEAAPTP